MHIIIFEDNFVPFLYPVTIGRAAFSISVGSLRLLNLVHELKGELELIVRPHLKEIIHLDIPNIWTAQQGKRKGPVLAINARTVPDANMVAIWKKLLSSEMPNCIYRNGTEIIAARLDDASVLPDQDIGSAQLLGLIDDLKLQDIPVPKSVALLNHPSDIIRHHLRVFNNNIEYRIKNGDYLEIKEGVFIPRETNNPPKIGEFFVSDCRNGPIIIESGVDIGPFCFIRGPVYIGPKSKVIEHAAIKDDVAVSSICKIGGEVEASVVEPYTNKQHHGFLGHSYLGSWVNLGAGTCNSDLKNSYNEVCMESPLGKHRSGMQFLGCVIGDYSKTAINTSLFTGKTIGACSMNYGFVTTAVPSFVNYARSFGQITEIPVEVMVATQARMFARRNVDQRLCDSQLLYDMYELTRHERQLASEPLSL
ncbi:MAG: putative sugar nucleotidyl transferase [Planctomycetia bacterium]|nr:putative sugar nucleotidyl transferase [Planctomycetia bacterium]